MKHQCLDAMKIMPIISQVSPKILLSCKPSGRAKLKQSHFTWSSGFSSPIKSGKRIFQPFFLKTKYQLDKQTAPWQRSSEVYHRYSDPNDLLWKRLNIGWGYNFTFSFHFHALEKEMATHSSVFAWRIPGTGEPGGLPSMGLHRVGHDWSYLAAAVCAFPNHACKTLWWCCGFLISRTNPMTMSEHSELVFTQSLPEMICGQGKIMLNWVFSGKRSY